MSDKPDQFELSDRIWLNETETANRLAMSPKWLQKMRYSGGGPKFAKFGTAVRYSLFDLKQYEKACLHLSTSDTGSGGGG